MADDRSDFTSVCSGIPQGSVLDPSLLMVYIKDPPELFTSLVCLFADDTAVYRLVTSILDQDQPQKKKKRKKKLTKL